MAADRVYLFSDGRRVGVKSLADCLDLAPSSGMSMDPALMEPAEAAGCRWVGHRIAKGVTHPGRDITVFTVPAGSAHGHHGRIIQGLGGVDPFPLCYEQESRELGFGGFIRWIYLHDPAGKANRVGLDFSLAAQPDAGIATGVAAAAAVVRKLVEHGLPAGTEVVLLNWKMLEEPYVREMREAAGLRTARDWTRKAERLFSLGGGFCPRCGLRTLETETPFCRRCGCRPDLVRKGARHVEA